MNCAAQGVAGVPPDDTVAGSGQELGLGAEPQERIDAQLVKALPKAQNRTAQRLDFVEDH
jgi:hypothetical protein